MPNPLILYDFHGSPCARRVRIVMLEKKTRMGNAAGGSDPDGTEAARVSGANPNGLVPMLLHGERVILRIQRHHRIPRRSFSRAALVPIRPWDCARAKMWQAFELAMAKEYDR